MARWSFVRRRPLLVPLVAVALVVGLAMPAGATSVAEYRDAKHRLQALSDEIRRREAALATSETRFEDLRADVQRVMARLDEIRDRSQALNAEVVTLQDRLQTLTHRLNEAVSSTYMHQPGGQLGIMLGVLTGSQSIHDLTDGMEFASRIANSTASVATEVLETRARLSEHLAELRALASEKADLLAGLKRQRGRLHDLNLDRRRALDRLSETQRKMIALVRRLHDEVAAQLFPLIGTAFQGGAHTSYGRWAVLFLQALEAPTCHSNEVVLVAWQLAEFTQAAWNPLATTKPMPGSWTFNSSSVQNFPSLETGLVASKLTLYDGWSSYGYGAIVNDLRACSSPYTTAHAIQASSWCHGCADGAYVVNKIGLVAANFDLYSRF
jgi:peptidoglycan hydrolase CwlO-like protein